MKEIAKVRKQRKTTTIIAALLSATIMLLPTLTATTTQHIAAQEQASAQEVKTLRIGYFPNINHAQAVTANIIVRPDYLKENPDVVKKLVAAHVNETQWINNDKEEAIKEFNTQLKKLTGQNIPEDVLAESLRRLQFTYDPIKQSLFKSANDVYDLGFLAKGESRPNLNGIYDLTLLDQILSEKGLPTIEGAATIGGPQTGSNNTTTDTTLPDVVS